MVYFSFWKRERMNGLGVRSKLFGLIPGISTIFWLCVGFSNTGCDSGERELFTIGFNCENPIHKNHATCGSSGSGSGSGAVSFATTNTTS